jgi:hypothetical protein
MSVENFLLMILMIGALLVSLIVAKYNNTSEPKEQGFADGIMVSGVVVWAVTFLALVADYFHLALGVSQ